MPTQLMSLLIPMSGLWQTSYHLSATITPNNDQNVYDFVYAFVEIIYEYTVAAVRNSSLYYDLLAVEWK